MSRTYLRYEPDLACGVIATNGGCAAHPSGQKLFVAAHDSINVWSTTNGMRLSYYESCLDASINVIIHHSRKNVAAVGMSNGRVLAFDTDLPMVNLTHSFLPSNSAITALSFSDDGLFLFAGTASSEIFVHDLVEGSITSKLTGGHSGPITRIATMGTKYLLSASRDMLVVLWDLSTRAKLQTLVECNTEVRALCVYIEKKMSSSDSTQASESRPRKREKIDKELRTDKPVIPNHTMQPDSVVDSQSDEPYTWFVFVGCADNSIHAWSTHALPPMRTILEILSEITEPNSLAFKYLALLYRLGHHPDSQDSNAPVIASDLSNALNDDRARMIQNVDTIQEAKALLDSDGKLLKYMGRMDKTSTEPTVSIKLVQTQLGAKPGEIVLALLVVSTKSVELYRVGSMEHVFKAAKRRLQKYARQKVEKLLAACKIDKEAAQYEVEDTMKPHLLSESAVLLKSTSRAVQTNDFLTSSLLIKSPYGEKLIDAAWIPKQNSVCLVSSLNFLKIFRVLVRDAANAAVKGVTAGGSGRGTEALRDSFYTYEETLEIALQGHRHVIHHASLSSDDTIVATCSQGEVKLWNIRKFICITTISLPKTMKTPTRVVILAGNKYSVVADSGGILGLINNIAAEVVDLVDAHAKRITDLQLSGGQLISSSEDGFVKFWSFGVTEDGGVSLNLEREFDAGHSVDVIRIDSPQKHILCALYDNTVRIYFLDTLRFKLVLYGHSMPITSMALSSTAEKLVTCSLDKTIRIWGLNFGECQKLIRFDSPFTDIQFIRDTRLGLAASRDGRLSYWDLDSFLLISILGEGRSGSYFSRGHFGECTSLCVSSAGRFVISVGHDKAIRQWIQTDDLINVRLEEQKRLHEAMTKEEEKTLGWEDPSKLQASRDGKNAGDILMEAVMLVSNELASRPESKSCNDPTSHLATYGKPPLEYLLSVMRTEIRHEVLLDALSSITVESARTLLDLLSQMLDQKYQPADFIVRCATFLITRYFAKAANTQGLAVLIRKAQKLIHETLRKQEEEARTALGCLEIMRSLEEGLTQ